MFKKLDEDYEIKMECPYCEGTGIYQGIAEHENIGAICAGCKGNGYYILDVLEEDKPLYEDKGDIIDAGLWGIVACKEDLFKGIKKKEGIKYVIYPSKMRISEEELKKEPVKQYNYITYEEFLSGRLPLPIEKWTCPSRFTQSGYDNKRYENGKCNMFEWGDNCQYLEDGDCWKGFYGASLTPEEKEEKLKRMKEKKSRQMC